MPKPQTKAPLCACGCGEPVGRSREGKLNRFIRFHARRGAIFTEEHRRKLALARRASGHAPWLGKKMPLSARKKMSAAKKGKPLTDEHKRKIGAASIGRKASPQKLAKMRARRHTQETRQKQSLAQKGERGSNWQGGLTTINQRERASAAYAEWRLSVFKRDRYRCQHCGARGEHAHHVKSFSTHPALRFNVANGLTLCIPCHDKAHGRKPR